LIDNTGGPVNDSRPLILSEDPMQRIRKLFHFDAATDEISVQTQQLLDPILAHNEAMRKADKGTWKGDGQHFVGRIPHVIWFALPDEIRDDHDALVAWLDRPENEIYRTKGGSLK